MPITRVPVVHKFGIISQTQRVDLEKRIVKKAYLETRRKLHAQQHREPRPLPFEVTEDFVYRFNDSGENAREKLEDTAFKMLKRLKRLAGLRHGGEADHVDLPRAWIDLALLAQCHCSKLEEACLEALIASLDQAAVAEEQVLSLFYLAKSGVHWLKKETGNQPVLRTNEILLVKMTRLVFLRLYCHHILNQLKEYKDQRISLYLYLKGLSEKAKSFEQFPGTYLSLQLISEAGRVICSCTGSTREEIIRNKSNTTTVIANGSTTADKQEGDANATDFQILGDTMEDEQIQTDFNNHTVQENAFPNSGKLMFLQCSLNVWHAVNHDPASLNDAICDLLEGATHLNENKWLDLVLAFHVLADASCNNVQVLGTFQYFMSFDFSPLVIPVDRGPHLCETCFSSLPTSPDKKRVPNSTSFRDVSKDGIASGEKRETTVDLVETLHAFVGLELPPGQEMEDSTLVGYTRDSTAQSNSLQTSGQETSIPVDPYSAVVRPPRCHTRHRWPWELVYTFCECLNTVCMYGACSEIQKVSLLGMSERYNRYQSRTTSNCGLIEFLGYEDGEDSWKVRYGAIDSLVRVCRYYGNDPTKDGITNVTWSAVTERQSTESEPGVLEAMKIAEVEAELEKKFMTDHIPTSLWSSRLAAALTLVHHHQVVAIPKAAPTEPAGSQAGKIHTNIPYPYDSEKCKKPTLRQQINLSNACMETRPDYATRQNFQLRTIIEDQWKKQLLEEMENEVQANIEQLDKKMESELKQTRIKIREKIEEKNVANVKYKELNI